MAYLHHPLTGGELGIHRKGLKLGGVGTVKHTAGGLHQILFVLLLFLSVKAMHRECHLGRLSNWGQSVKDFIAAQLIH